MSDSRHGSKTFARALSERFGRKPHLRVHESGSGNWVCEGGTLVAGVGPTPEEAYVDHVEEAWCFSGEFPEGYPT